MSRIDPIEPLRATASADDAAIILMLLNDGDAAAILSRLEPEELELLGGRICALGEVDHPGMAAAIAGFIESADGPDLPITDKPRHLSRLMTQAVGEVKARGMMQRIAPQSSSRTIEVARWLSPEVLAPLLFDEHPQAIAVLLLMLEAEPAAALLAALPRQHQTAVVERIARLGPVSGHAVAMLDELLERRLAERFGHSTLKLGGVREAAEMMNKATGRLDTVIMPEIAAKDRPLADAIEAEMFRFEQIAELEPVAMGRLLREVENAVLVDALKGIKEEERLPFFVAMSVRAADGVKDEMEVRGRIRRGDVEQAQQSMVETARRLAASGEIAFGAGDDDYV